MKRLPFYAILGVLLFMAVSQYVAVRREAFSARRSYEVQQICDKYTRSNSADDYRACGDVQSTYNLEYMCSGLTATASCWVETK